MSNAETPKRVLVIDDEEVVHASLKRILGRLGLEVVGVLSAQDGIARLSAERYDLLITDLMMPKMSGLEMLEELQEREIHLPILMITGYPTIRTAIRAMRLGAVDYVAKPFRRKELLGPVKRALRLEDANALPPGNTGSSLDAVALDDLAPGMRLLLPHHSWAEYQQDGTFLIGVAPDFLKAAGIVAAVDGPQEMDLVEQGHVAIRLTNETGDVHGVAMPLSGQVMGVQLDALAHPETLDASTWLLRIIPSQLASELELLLPPS